jgi:hypothetical protein
MHIPNNKKFENFPYPQVFIGFQASGPVTGFFQTLRTVTAIRKKGFGKEFFLHKPCYNPKILVITVD